MKTRILIANLVLACSAHAQERLQPLPANWTAAGLDRAGTQCTAGVDPVFQDNGGTTLTIACRADATPVVRQAFQPEPLWGKSVRFSGWVRTQGLSGDGPNGTGGAGLFIETGRSRRVSIVPIVRLGGPEWEFREVVVEVPRGDTKLSVGLWLGARGQVWTRDFKFEALDGTMPLAGPMPLAPLPAGWEPQNGAGSPPLPGGCEIGIDSQASAGGPQIYSVNCANERASFGGARQMFDSSGYRGKRVRVSGWIKATGVEGAPDASQTLVDGAAGLWLGVGSRAGGIRMDRMENRAIKGSTDWTYQEFVADIPNDSMRSIVGFWMQGKGQIRVRDLKVEEVPKTVPVNSPSAQSPQPAGRITF